ncbi:MAG TPA: crosslink repair DNA glycosylase YcaQ family protein [Jatrophihabitans sp.]
MSGARSRELTREQVLAYRVAAQGLHRDASSIAGLGVLDIGVQEAMGHPAALAFAARLPPTVALGPGAVAVGPGHPLALAWTMRGAPHVHRRDDLDALGRALWPLSEADAAGRLNETGPSVRRAGIPALEQFTTAVAAMRHAVSAPTAKGAASTAVTLRIPESMRRECRPCRTRHISDPAMRCAACAAGLEIEPGTAPPVLVPRTHARLPSGPDAAAVGALARGYLTYLGPARVQDVAGYLGARRADLERVWPAAALMEVRVAGGAAWLPEPCVDLARAAPAPDAVRLLGPFDPYLQARDRDLLVPNRSLHSALWPVLGRPGAVLVDGEITGTWRTRATAARLTISVEAFGALPGSVWRQLDAEAARVAEVRCVADVVVKRVR